MFLIPNRKAGSSPRILYVIYHDLVNIIKHCKVALYADDTVLYTSCRDFQKSIDHMQKDIGSISTW